MAANIPRALSAKYKTDFAYPSVKDRLPVILTKVIDTVFRLKNDVGRIHGQAGLDDLRQIISQLSQLKNRVQTNKPLVALSDRLPDCAVWDQYLSDEQTRDVVPVDNETDVVSPTSDSTEPKWFLSSWLFVECYFYRKIISAISVSNQLKDLDPFRGQKQEALTESAVATATLTSYLTSSISSPAGAGDDGSTRLLFDRLFHVTLWGNKCDLSISAGASNHQTVDPLSQLDGLASFVLHDDSDRVWDHLQTLKGGGSGVQRVRRVDIVLDNAGFELVTDLCLAELLVSRGLADVVHFHVKAMPWFVSDVTRDDWNWTLSYLTRSVTTTAQSTTAQSTTAQSTTAQSTTTQSYSNSTQSTIIQAAQTRAHELESQEPSFDDPDSVGYQFKGHIENGSWVVTTHQFWTLPFDFGKMATVSPDLYMDLQSSDLIIFKGDLNYRKLVGDLKWAESTSLMHALRGFNPAPLVALRTLKSDVVVGVEPDKARRAADECGDWMVAGSYGVIQFCDVQ
jgi:uncharacterized protein with ATP-grasp and redox domains